MGLFYPFILFLLTYIVYLQRLNRFDRNNIKKYGVNDIINNHKNIVFNEVNIKKKIRKLNTDDIGNILKLNDPNTLIGNNMQGDLFKSIKIFNKISKSADYQRIINESLIFLSVPDQFLPLSIFLLNFLATLIP